MSKKQTTLFNSWGTKEGGKVGEDACPEPSRPSTSGGRGAGGDDAEFHWEDDFGDCLEDFLGDVAVTEAELDEACDEGPSSSVPAPITTATTTTAPPKQTTLPFHIGPSASAQSILDCSVIEDEIPGFDQEAGEMWIYPTNYPVRDYQFNIVKKALFVNTLVCLPTGLGKTFVAAVVMYNFYRWYPSGKVVFLAPTKPLVAQQIEACHKIVGIPQEDVAEMTGM